MADESEFIANVRYYLKLRSEGRPCSDEAVVLGSRGVRWRGGDPIQLTRQLDGYADEIGQSDAIRALRGRIGQDWDTHD